MLNFWQRNSADQVGKNRLEEKIATYKFILNWWLVSYNKGSQLNLIISGMLVRNFAIRIVNELSSNKLNINSVLFVYFLDCSNLTRTCLLLRVFVRIWLVYFLKCSRSVRVSFVFGLFKLNEFVREHIVHEHINKFVRE